MKAYVILGGGGSFGIHTAFSPLAQAKPKKVIGIDLEWVAKGNV